MKFSKQLLKKYLETLLHFSIVSIHHKWNGAFYQKLNVQVASGVVEQFKF